MNSERKPHIAPFLLLAGASLCAAGSLFFGFLYFTLYWPFRGRFNEEGRYFDETSMVVHHEQAGLLILPTLALLSLAILLAVFWWFRRRHASGGAVGGP